MSIFIAYYYYQSTTFKIEFGGTDGEGIFVLLFEIFFLNTDVIDSVKSDVGFCSKEER